jgi:hypothetical protein
MKTKDVSYRAVYKSDHLGVVDLEEMHENNQTMVVGECTTLAELQAAYTALPSNEKTLATVVAKKDELKTILS